MTIRTLADFIGADAKVQLVQPPADGASKDFARRIWLTAHGSSNARFGDTNVGAARGVELPADAIVVISASDADIADRIPLIQQFLYVPSGTTVTVTFGI